MRNIEARICFTNLSKKQLRHLFKAEKQLRKAEITFDTGYGCGQSRRDWEFDWSLKGAEVYYKRDKN